MIALPHANLATIFLTLSTIIASHRVMIKTMFLLNFKIEWIPHNQKKNCIATIFHLTVLIWKKKDEKSWKCTLLLNAKSLDNFYFNPYAIY